MGSSAGCTSQDPERPVKQPSRLAPIMFAYLCRRRLEEHLSGALGALLHVCVISRRIRVPFARGEKRSLASLERRRDLNQPFHVLGEPSGRSE